MAGWISSKLQVAQSLLEQIDQQAAESLGKPDKPRSHELNIGFDQPSGNLYLKDQFKKKPLKTPELLNKSHIKNIRGEKHSRTRHLHGLNRSTSTSIASQPEVTIEEAPGRSLTKVAKPLPVLGIDDWTELLASPEFTSRGSSLGNSDNTVNSNATGKTSVLAGKDVYKNGVSNAGISVSIASKHAPSSSYNSKLLRSACHSDSLASSTSLDSNKFVRHDNNSRHHLEPDSRGKEDEYRIQNETPPTRGASISIIKPTNEQDILPGGNSSTQGSGSDASKAEGSTKARDGLENTNRNGYGGLQANEGVDQHDEGFIISSSSISTSHVKEDSLIRLQQEPSYESTVESHVKATETISTTLKEAGPHSQNGGQYEVQELQMIDVSSKNGENQQESEDSNNTSLEKIKERNRFATDASELQVDDMKRCFKQGQERTIVESEDVHGSSSESDKRSDIDTDSTSGSDSEDDEVERHKQRQRKKREEQMAAEAAAIEAAKATIKERDEFVKRLEREKERLENILAEREEQQAREAAELQINMKEAMHAADLEKKKHNITRMEALARAAKLETENAELAKSLAAVQRSLELELDRVAEIRQKIESKEVAQAELERKLSHLRHKLACSSKMEISKGCKLEQEIFEEENLQLCQNIEQLQIKVKQLEETIDRTREAWEGPTEVEVELESRLSQLTDLLIQKQAQVEALSAETATLLFRLEGLAQSNISKGKKSSVLLDSVSIDDDLEFGLARSYGSRSKEINEHRDFGGRTIFFVLHQLDTIFSAGAYYLRRHGTAKYCAFAYLLALHIWVIFVLFLHSQEAEGTKSGALFSLDSINNATSSLNSTQS